MNYSSNNQRMIICSIYIFNKFIQQVWNINILWWNIFRCACFGIIYCK